MSNTNGGMLETGGPFIFSIHCPEEDEKPTHVEINLFSSEGEKVASQSIANPQSDEDLYLDFPDLDTGQYKIEFVLYGQNAILAGKRTY